MSQKKVKLFVYGSLRDRRVFYSVSSLNFSRKPSMVKQRTLFAELAFLANHRKVSPDNVYFYAIKDSSARIEGLLIHNVPAEAMAEIDKYEGKRYQRQNVLVNTANGRRQATAYLVSHESMKKHFGDRFHVDLIHELWLRKRIEKFIRKRIRPGEKTAEAQLERRADRELLATTERDLVMTHFGSDAVSDYYLEHELDRPRPSIKHLYEDSEAKPFIKKYLALVVKQVLFNQLEERIQARYRFELDHMRSSERYFKRSVSILMALQMMNSSKSSVDMIVQKCLKTTPGNKNDLIDYIKYAVRASRSVFDYRVAQNYLNRIRSNFQPGLIPLGAEIELSNIGAAAVEPQRSLQNRSDPIYDGFRYYHDFHLDVLSWKLGGYIDDHSGTTDQSRRQGFLELSPGRLNVTGELSRPATADPWLLNRLIHETATFYNVRPHSLHLSFQLRKRQLGNQKMLPLDFVKCLLVLGGGVEKKKNGKLWISRMGSDEIIQHEYGEELVFMRTSKRKWYLGEDDIAEKVPTHAITHIQQYKFIRLEAKTNYEPLILCLKGLQLACNPGDYLTVQQLKNSKKFQKEYAQLKSWSTEPDPISSRTINRFMKTIRTGLMNERHYKPAHKLHYIEWALNSIDTQLRNFNEQLK